jgi:hypothetical protein
MSKEDVLKVQVSLPCFLSTQLFLVSAAIFLSGRACRSLLFPASMFASVFLFVNLVTFVPLETIRPVR